jgi:hypothetical protein
MSNAKSLVKAFTATVGLILVVGIITASAQTSQFVSMMRNARVFFADGTTAAPSITFASQSTTGFALPSAGNLTYSSGGNPYVLFGANLVRLGSTTNLGWSSGTVTGAAEDTILCRGAANVIGIGGCTSGFPAVKRNGASLQVKLADDSASAILSGSILYSLNAAPTNGSGTGITVNDSGMLRTSVYQVTVASTAFVSAAVTSDVTIATLPAKTQLLAVYADLTQVFACTATCTTATLSFTLGSSAGGTDLLLTFDADAATLQRGLADADLGASLTRATAIQGGKIFSWSATTPVSLRLTSGTGNIGTGAATNLSQGSITFYLVTTRLP